MSGSSADVAQSSDVLLDWLDVSAWSVHHGDIAEIRLPDSIASQCLVHPSSIVVDHRRLVIDVRIHVFRSFSLSRHKKEEKMRPGPSSRITCNYQPSFFNYAIRSAWRVWLLPFAIVIILSRYCACWHLRYDFFDRQIDANRRQKDDMIIMNR